MQNAGCGNNYISYTIAKGQTLYTIARQFGITVAEILAANPALDVQLYYAGDVICIPKPGGGSGSTCNGHAHTIVRGDTYQALAQHYGVTVAAITNANPGVNPNRLQVGQIICIPGAPAPAPTPPVGCTGTAHTIVRGDTYYTLAQHYGVTVAAITAANPGVDPNALRVGQVICIPGTPAPAPTPTPPVGCTGTAHTIVRGDTYYTLAQHYGVTVAAITAANPGVDPNALRVGQIICIPGQPAPTPPAPTPPVECTGTAHTIVRGDTYYTLAQHYGVTVAAITAANPGVDPNALRVGQVICIPIAPAPTPPTPTPPVGCTGTAHTIVRGDTYYTLAQHYGVTVAAITAANPGVDPNALRVGQIICIPGHPAPEGCTTFSHTVARGESFYSIAQLYGITVADLIAANPGVDPAKLQIGQVLCIPTPPTPPEPAPAPTPVACQIGLNGIGYVVQRGDTFYKIAQQYGLTVQALQEANPGVDPARLQIGQVLCIPGGQPAPTPCPAGHSVHTVTSGQTLTDILVLYNLGYNALAQANAGVDLANLRTGQLLCIAPRGTRGGCAGGGASYQMTNTDTLSTMAARFGVTIGDILLANPHMAPTDFPTGRVICLPAHART